MLSRISSNITRECKMEMHNADIFQSMKLLPMDFILIAEGRLSQVLRDEAIMKVVSKRRPPQPSRPEQQ